jgi:hypothetical protein
MKFTVSMMNPEGAVVRPVLLLESPSITSILAVSEDKYGVVFRPSGDFAFVAGMLDVHGSYVLSDVGNYRLEVWSE